MTRHEDEIARATRRLAAAAFSVIDSGGTLEEAERAFAEGIAQVRAMQERTAAARRQYAEAPQPSTAPTTPGRHPAAGYGRHVAA